GILVGRSELIQRAEKDPLMRAFRLDKMTLVALEATLRVYLNEKQAASQIPVLRMLGAPLVELRQRAEGLAEKLQRLDAPLTVNIAEDSTYAGGGSLPDQVMKSCVLELVARDVTEQELAYRLRTSNPPVVGRLQEGKLLLDLRTILPGQEDAVVDAVR